MKGKAKNQNKSVPTQFDPSEEVENLAKVLIGKFHTHLVNCKIAYLWKNKKIKAKGREVAATAEKVSAKHHALSGYHFLITVSYPTWQEMDDKQRLAVVDHELTHCFVDDDEKTGEPKYSIVSHDVEEFGSVIMRHGLYTVDLERIGRVVSDALEAIGDKTVVRKLGKPDSDVVVPKKEDKKPAKKAVAVEPDEDDEEEAPPKKKARVVEEEEEEEEDEDPPAKKKVKKVEEEPKKKSKLIVKKEEEPVKTKKAKPVVEDDDDFDDRKEPKKFAKVMPQKKDEYDDSPSSGNYDDDDDPDYDKGPGIFEVGPDFA